jgi:hypothetical protein
VKFIQLVALREDAILALDDEGEIWFAVVKRLDSDKPAEVTWRPLVGGYNVSRT